jgi:hypothetical protein
MKRTVIEHFQRADDETATLAFTRCSLNQFVYLLTIQDGEDTLFFEHYASDDGEQNKRNAYDKYEEYVTKFSEPKFETIA